MVEVALWEYTGECEMAPIEKAVNKHLEWYKGDGAYGDGPPFHWDYYNSFVIQPMLLDVVRICVKKTSSARRSIIRSFWKEHVATLPYRNGSISPEATFPSYWPLILLSLWGVPVAFSDGAGASTSGRSLSRRRTFGANGGRAADDRSARHIR